ncbi:hypothetical protein C4568_02680 [Candidatus Parcubacteria bacterium]|nr:MAG: hypothetical protein C4568_02680 [Candidatus Parcubacteria bacterium]
MEAIQSLFSVFAGFLAIDVVVLAAVVVAAGLDGIRAGTRRASVFVIAAPLAVVLYEAAFRTAYIGNIVLPLNALLKFALFAAIFVFLYILLYRIVPASFGTGPVFVQGLFGGLAVAITIAIVWLQVPALVTLYEPSAFLQSIFNASYRALWLLVALILLAIVRR